MNCKVFETDLKAYIDNELTPGRRAQVDRHIAACEQCRDEVTAMKTISKTIEHSEIDEPISDGLRNRILAQAAVTSQERKAPKDPSQARPFLTPSVARIWIGAIAASVIAAAVILPVAMKNNPIRTGIQPLAYESRSANPEAAHSLAPLPYTQSYGKYLHNNGHSNPDVDAGPSAMSPRVDLEAPMTQAPKNQAYTVSDIGVPDRDNDKKPSGSVPFAESGTSRNSDLTGPNESVSTKVTSGSDFTTANSASDTPPTVPLAVPSVRIQAGVQVAQTPPDTANEVDGTRQPLFVQNKPAGPGMPVFKVQEPAQNVARGANGAAVLDRRVGGVGGGFGGLGQAQSNALPGDIPISQRQVHREATLTIETADPESASESVESTVKSVGGFVADSTLSTDGAGTKSAQMTLKVPVAQFDSVLDSIEKLGNVTSKNVTGEDITAKVSDASESESVLEEDTEQSDTEIEKLGRHATWDDRENNRQLHIELAEARGRVETLGKLAELSDMVLTLTQPAKAVPPVKTGMLNDLQSSGIAALQSVATVIDFILCAAIWAVAFVPVWDPLVFAGWYVRRRLSQA